MNNKGKEILNIIKDIIILLLITLVAGFLLGYVNNITASAIVEQKELAANVAYKEVFPTATKFENMDYKASDALIDSLLTKGFNSSEIGEVNVAKDDSDNVLGYVITVISKEAYEGQLRFTMGINNDGLLYGISILDISETPGLGMKAGEVLVPQFANKQVEAFKYTKTGSNMDSEIDAISGATVTTNAIVNGVNAGMECFYIDLNGGKGNEE